MKHSRLHSLVHEQTGSSLLTTLVMITIMTVLIGAVLAFYLAQYQFFRRDAHRLQARYAAEAAVYIAIDSLQQNPRWRPQEARIELPEDQTSRVTIEDFGGYLYIRATAPYRRSRSTTRALVGVIPPTEFDNAIYLWDTESNMHVAGSTRVTGDIVVGPRGMRESTFKRRRFTGEIDGDVHRLPDITAPFFDNVHWEQTIDHLERALAGSSGAPPPEEGETLPLARRLPSENPVFFAPGHLRLTPDDSDLLRAPLTVVARGNLTLDGPLRFKPGSVFIAGDSLLLNGEIVGREGVFFGREGISTTGAVQCAGQFFSRKKIRIAEEAHLRYPSVLYIAGEAIEEGGVIFIDDDAAVDGTIIHPRIEPEPRISRGRIIIEPEAQVRGALYNTHETEFHGTLHGTLLTYQLYFYESPTSYINWLKDAVVDVDERPVKYLLPLGFTPWPRFAVLHWDAHVEEPEEV